MAPRVTHAPIRILVVCKVNLARSPLGERLLQKAADSRLGGDIVEVASAGVAARPGLAAAAPVVARGRGLAVDLDDHRSQPVDPAEVRDADLVLTMTRRQRDAVARRAPGAVGHIFTWKEFVHLAGTLDDLPSGPPSARVAAAVQAAHRRRPHASVLEDRDIPDPAGQPSEAYDELTEDLQALVADTADVLFGPLPGEPAGGRMARRRRQLAAAAPTNGHPRAEGRSDPRGRASRPEPVEPPRGRRIRTRTILLTLGLLAVLAIVVGAVLVNGALDARGELETARDAMTTATTAVADRDLETVRQELDRARDAVARAQAATSGPEWTLTRQLPLVGRSPAVLHEAVAVADGLVEVGAEAVDRAESLLAVVSDGGFAVTDGQVDLAPLADAEAALDALPLADLEAAVDRLAAAETTWVPEAVRAGRRDALRATRESLDTFDNLDAALGVLPTFLGADGDRRYLLALQTSAELRGTGGLLGYVGALTARDGRLELEEQDVLDPVGAMGSEQIVTDLGGYLPEPVDTPPAFAGRYASVNADQILSNSNADPHLPMTAPIVLDQVRAHTGDEFDGMVALDPVGLAEVLRSVGPVELPAEVVDAEGRLPQTVQPDDLAELITIDIYEVYGSGRSFERARYFQALATASFDALLDGSRDGWTLTNRLADAAGRRHLQLYSRHPGEQEAFGRLGLAGAMSAASHTDLLAVTANNAVGGKQDVHVGHAIEGVVEILSEPGTDGRPWRRFDWTVRLDNPLPASGRDEYIIGNCLIDVEGTACFEGPPGWNRTWFTVWAPQSASGVTVQGAGGEQADWDEERIHGHLAIDHVLETPPQDTASFSGELEGPVTLLRDGPDLVYRLELWRQAKAIPDHWDLTIVAPPEWDVADATVAGGGDGQGMGVGGDGAPLTVDVEEGRVRVTGSATQDAVVEVRFTQGLWERWVE